MENDAGASASGGARFHEASFSALDRYRGNPPGPLRFLLFRGGLPELARLGCELEFPGLPYADAVSPESRAGSPGRIPLLPSVLSVRTPTMNRSPTPTGCST